MKKFLFFFASLLFFASSPGVSAAAEAKNFEIAFVVAHGNATPLQHTAVIELGKKVRVIQGPNRQTGQYLRLDYTVTGIGVAEDGKPVAKMAGAVYTRTGDSAWQVGREFSSEFFFNKKAKLQVGPKAGGGTAMEFEIRPLSEADIKAKYGQLPEAKACEEDAPRAANAKGWYCEYPPCGGGEDDDQPKCCTRQCANPDEAELTCCGGRICCGCGVCCNPR